MTHVPDTTSAADGAWVLVSIVLNVDLRGRVLSPNRSPIDSFKLARRATESVQGVVIDKIDTLLTKDKAVARLEVKCMPSRRSMFRSLGTQTYFWATQTVILWLEGLNSSEASGWSSYRICL